MRGGGRWGTGRGTGRKNFSLLLLKEKGTAVGEGTLIGKIETAERKTLSPFHLMLMGRTLTEETRPARWNGS